MMQGKKGAATAVLIVGLASLSALGAEFVHGPYSGAPSRNSVVISWLVEDPVVGRVEFGLDSEYMESGSFTHSVDVPPFTPDPLNKTTHVLLDGLDRAAKYVYRVTLIQSDSETISPVGSFSTESVAGEPVEFAVISDTQQQLEGVNRLALVAHAVAADPAGFDFILHAGDVVESPSSYYWDDWFSAFGDMLLRAPFVPVLGNHEKNHRSYYDAFELPPGAGKDDERWWALHWGDVVVVGLDSNVTKATDYTAQQEWARMHLSGPEPCKFVVFHHPVFSSDAEYGTGMFLDQIFHPIFVECGVDIVFNGHSHHYEHIVRDGVTYLVVGGGGATPRHTRPEHIEGSDVSVEGHHFYLRVRITVDGISVETVGVARELGTGECRDEMTILDSFMLPREAQDTRPSAVPLRTGERVPSVVAALLLVLAAAGVLLLLQLRK